MSKNMHPSNMTDGSIVSVETNNSAMDPYAHDAPELNWSADLNSDHYTQIELASVFKPGKARNFYDYMAPNYEGIYSRIGYPDPQAVADMALA
jgi:hypothetical protein